MAAGFCELCHRQTRFGRNIRHQHTGRWERKAPKTNRQFRPNVHKQRVWLNGSSVRVNVCTRCVRSLGKVTAAGKPLRLRS